MDRNLFALVAAVNYFESLSLWPFGEGRVDFLEQDAEDERIEQGQELVDAPVVEPEGASDSTVSSTDSSQS